MGVKTSTLISQTAQCEVTVQKPEKLQESSKWVLRTRQFIYFLLKVLCTKWNSGLPISGWM